MIDGGWPTSKKRPRHRIDDRFSELPDHLLRRVLSFLDSKSAVQTCLLSRRWRSVWKGVPALNLDSKSFITGLSFLQFVSGILSRRYDSAGIDEISFQIDWDFDLPEPRSMYQKLFDYAASHGIRSLRVHNNSNEDLWDWFAEYRFNSPAIRMLTTLHLQGLRVYWPSKWDRVDPFAGFPNLRDLTLRECDWSTDDVGWDEEENDYICLRISGIQLRNLRIENLYAVCKVGIFAPNLESLHYVWVRDLGHLEFFELHLPSLHRAYIQISSHYDLVYGGADVDTRGWLVPVSVAGRRLMNLFQGLQSATTLELHSDTFQILERICESFEFQTSPFTRLKTLIFSVECKEKLFDIPYVISHYFLGNPTNKERKSTKVKLTCSKV